MSLGWFSLLSEDGKTAPYYSSIEEVAAARLAVFLSRHDVPAYVMTDNGKMGRDGTGRDRRDGIDGTGRDETGRDEIRQDGTERNGTVLDRTEQDRT